MANLSQMKFHEMKVEREPFLNIDKQKHQSKDSVYGSASNGPNIGGSVA